MRIATMIPASRQPMTEVGRKVADYERAGVDVVLVAEAYSFDAVSRVGYLAAVTERVTIGTGIINVFSRTATAIGQTAAGCDYVTGGRFLLGLGTSGPQVIEGFHGVPYAKPRSRTLDVIDVVRKVVAREVVVHDGPTATVPLPAAAPGATGLGKPL
jgi:alkanesulfonate monooxygenase SsuD/methylene tetrahydromethanopterin reductase-like flavin-dependent oxidoreductase (luciferase family)